MAAPTRHGEVKKPEQNVAQDGEARQRSRTKKRQKATTTVIAAAQGDDRGGSQNVPRVTTVQRHAGPSTMDSTEKCQSQVRSRPGLFNGQQAMRYNLRPRPQPTPVKEGMQRNSTNRPPAVSQQLDPTADSFQSLIFSRSKPTLPPKSSSKKASKPTSTKHESKASAKKSNNQPVRKQVSQIDAIAFQLNTLALRDTPPLPDLIPIPSPNPTQAYLTQAQRNPPSPLLSEPQRLLLILDLNGVLIHRKRSRSPTSFTPRPGLARFLDYCLTQHAVMIWTSMHAHNASVVLDRLLSAHQRRQLLAVWTRDDLRLTPAQLNLKVQVYKVLRWVWDALPASAIASDSAELATQGSRVQATHTRWDQRNTLLLDDSKEKGRSEPWNLLAVPEFLGGSDDNGLEAVRERIEQLSRWEDVSQGLYQLRASDGLQASRQDDAEKEDMQTEVGLGDSVSLTEAATRSAVETSRG